MCLFIKIKCYEAISVIALADNVGQTLFQKVIPFTLFPWLYQNFFVAALHTSSSPESFENCFRWREK